MKKVLVYINVILGSMAALFSGCHSHKPVVCKYGVPQEILDRRKDEARRRDSVVIVPPEQVEIIQQDTVPEPPVPDIPVCKYGPPGGDW